MVAREGPDAGGYHRLCQEPLEIIEFYQCVEQVFSVLATLTP